MEEQNLDYTEFLKQQREQHSQTRSQPPVICI